MLLLKLILVPALIAAVTLAARRWGARVGGMLVGLPVVAGPTLGFYALEQGPIFASAAAASAVLAVVSVLGFAVAYARASRAGWPFSLGAGYAAWLLATLMLIPLQLHIAVVLLVSITACAMAYHALPASGEPRRSTPPPRWDLPLRMVAAA